VVTLMRRLGSPKLTTPQAVLMLHHPRGVPYASRVGAWQKTDERAYGSTRISFFSRAPATAE
jgi:hypothetical protein